MVCLWWVKAQKVAFSPREVVNGVVGCTMGDGSPVVSRTCRGKVGGMLELLLKRWGLVGRGVGSAKWECFSFLLNNVVVLWHVCTALLCPQRVWLYPASEGSRLDSNQPHPVTHTTHSQGLCAYK